MSRRNQQEGEGEGEMRTIRRAVVISCCGALLAFGQGTAWAEGESVVTYTGSPGAGSEISVVAAVGKANTVHFTTADRCDGTLTTFCISDISAGITESSPHCTQESAAVVRCQSQGLDKVEINSGDGGDTLRWLTNVPDVTVPANVIVRSGSGNDRVGTFASFGESDEKYHIVVSGGPGNDKMFGHLAGLLDHAQLSAGGGRDRIRVAAGAATVLGGAAGDVLLGGLGPQRIFGGRGNDAISCGKGKDLANGGPGLNRGGRGCERVIDPSRFDEAQ